MKNWKTRIGFEKAATSLVGAFAVLSLLWESASAATPTTPQRHAVSIEQGATRLKDFRPPEVLLSETNSPVLAPLATAWANLSPELTRYATTRSNHTVQIAVHRIHPALDRPVLVFIHGVLADHRTWEYVAAELARDYEIWLVDLPGCGDSDAPKPSSIEPDGYSPTAMGERVWQALKQCMEAGGSYAPRRLSLVGHSLGTMVIIRMMSAPELRAHYAGVIRSVDRVALLAPCDLAVNSVPPSFRALLGLSGFKVGLGKFLGVFKPAVRDLVWCGYQIPECATREREALVYHALADRRHRESAKAMLRQAVPFGPKTRRPQWEEIDVLVDDYANINVPVLIIYGIRDESLSAAMGNKLKDEIPGAVLVKVPRRGHALPTEDPRVCAALIQRFQQGRTPVELSAGLGARTYPATTMLGANLLPSAFVAPSPDTTTSEAVR